MTDDKTIARPRILVVLIVFLLFLATGMSGLIYQVVWQRYLLNVFGATIYSVSTVLAAFMGGLALGSWLFGRMADRVARPLFLYGLIEIFIGLAALLVPFMLRILDPVFTTAYQSFGSNFLLYSIIRFVFVFLILLIPTTLMGGTFPLLSRFVAPAGRAAGLRVGLLYALNTTGAVLGTILSGFYFIRWWGVSRTVLLAAAINIGAGLAAMLLSRGFPLQKKVESDGVATQPLSSATRSRTALILLTYAISGFVALGLEVVWARSLVFTFDALKNTTYSFTAMLAVFLVGIAMGSAVMTPYVEREKNPFRLFAALQIAIGLTSILSFFVLYLRGYDLGNNWLTGFDSSGVNIRWAAAVALVFLKTAAVVLLPTFCMGLAFPVAVRAIGATEVGREVGQLYALNTLGAILGSALTGFLFLPTLGITSTIFLLGFLQIAAGVLLMLRDRESTTPQRFLWTGVASAAIIATLLGYARIPKPIMFQKPLQTEMPVFYKEGPFATVSVLQNSLGYRTIYVDNVGVAGTDPMLLTDQKSLAHVPMLLLKEPRSALTVGFGSGGASYSYTLYPELEDVHCVEITRTVVEAAPTLTDSNRGVVTRRNGNQPTSALPLWADDPDSGFYKSDSRYQVVLDDARSYLRFTQKQYDVIATDCTDLRYKSNANLYDLQYFQLTRERITDDGMVCVWMPLAGLSDEAMKVALRTFYKVFPNMEVFFMNNEPTHYILLLGTKNPLKVDVNLMRERLARPEIRKDLGELSLASPEKILSCFITGREKMRDYLAGVEILNTEDFPYLEFESPRYGYGDDPLLDNLDELMKFFESPRRLVVDGSADEAFMASLEKYHSAVPEIIKGHREYRALRVTESAKHYIAALQLCPEDVAIQKLLDFEELRRKVRGQPGNIWAQWQLGESLALQKRDAEAAAQLNEVIARPVTAGVEGERHIREIRKAAMETLASIYERGGKLERATEYRNQAARELP